MDQSIELVQDASPDDFLWYRDEASKVMLAAIELANSIYITHPQLKPQQIGGTYQIPAGACDPEFYLRPAKPRQRRSRRTRRGRAR